MGEEIIEQTVNSIESESNTQNSTPVQAEFSIPDEYKEKEWVKNYDGKSGDELKNEIFKTVDEAYGSKAEIPTDFKAYGLENMLKETGGNLPIGSEAVDTIAGKFKDLGITENQGKEIFKTYLDLTLEDFKKVTDPNELEKSVNEIFKGNKEERLKAESLIKEFLPEEDKKMIEAYVPNAVIEMFYKVAKGMIEKYDYKENTANSNKQDVNIISAEDKQRECDKIIDEIQALDKRFHTDEEKKRLIDKLVSLSK